MDSTTDEVYQYTTTGSSTGFSFDTAASGSISPQGITYHNGYFWIVDSTTDEVYQYTTSTSTGGYIALNTNGLERLRIDENGKVIVGTSTAALRSSGNIPDRSLIVNNGIICVDNGGDNCDDAVRTRGRIYAEAARTTAIDVAENYPTKDIELEAGDLVMLDENNPVFVTKYVKSEVSTTTARASSTAPRTLLGVVSTNPGVLLGGFGNDAFLGEREVPVALAGRVPTKVNLEGGDIRIGDRISFSTVPGVGQKARTSAMTVGIALESFVATSTSASTTEGLVTLAVYTDYSFHPDQFSIDENGNVGIGTTTDSAYRVRVGGDIAATGFVNVSASSTKKDIVFLDDTDLDDLVNVIRYIDLATYRYDFEDAEHTSERLGLIADVAPSEILSTDGAGVDLYKLSTLTLGGVKDIDERLQQLELSLYGSTSSSTLLQKKGGGMRKMVTDFLASVGVFVTESVTSITSLVTSDLTVGSSEKPTGITIYDEVTGEPYCMRVRNGAMVSLEGACDSVTEDANQEENQDVKQDENHDENQVGQKGQEDSSVENDDDTAGDEDTAPTTDGSNDDGSNDSSTEEATEAEDDSIDQQEGSAAENDGGAGDDTNGERNGESDSGTEGTDQEDPAPADDAPQTDPEASPEDAANPDAAPEGSEDESS